MLNMIPKYDSTFSKERQYLQIDFKKYKYTITQFGSRCKKTCLRGFVNNKDADQPAYPRRLISAFVIPFLECIISKLATGEITIF